MTHTITLMTDARVTTVLARGSKRVQSGFNGWRGVSVVVCDSRVSTKVKWKMYSTVVRPAIL